MTRRPAAVLLVLLLALVATTATQFLPRSAFASSCITVVVQGQGQRCVAAGGSGLAVMTRAGFRPNTNTPHNPGYVCQINSSPRTCTAPNASAYWAYFHAAPGGSWAYSSSGAGSYTPQAGHCEGWRFETSGARTAPSTACPATTGSQPTHPPTTRPTGGSGGGSSPAGGHAHLAPIHTQASATSTKGATRSPAPRSSGSSQASAGGTEASVSARPTTRTATGGSTTSSGNGWAAGAGVALVLLIGTGAVVVARRR